MKKIIKDENILRRVIGTLKAVQKSVQEVGLKQEVVIMGSAVIGRQSDLDFYLDVENIYERSRKFPHPYLYLNTYEHFQEKLDNFLNDKSLVGRERPVKQLHNLNDRGSTSQLPKRKYGYFFYVSADSVHVETQDTSYLLSIDKLDVEKATWTDLNSNTQIIYNPP